MAAAFACAACEESTDTIGIFADHDAIAATSSSYHFTTRTIMLDSIMASSTKCYLGHINDPQTGTALKAEFAAQFHCFEDYRLPDNEKLVKGEDGEVVADSVEIRFYFTDYYGDANNPMKVSVYELDTTNVMSETDTYYSNVDLTQYLPADAKPIVTKVFTPADFTLDDDVRTSSTHYKNVRFVLPTEYGTRILRHALRSPQHFKDSWQFIHHVCPGFYFKLESGRGTMLTMDVGTFNIYFQYNEGDSTYVGLSRFAATPEVIQSTCIDNSGLEELIKKDTAFTYLKSPAGLATEITLPIDSIYIGHDNDSVSLARLILSRYNNSDVSSYNLGVPTSLLLLRKQDVGSFFAERKVANGETSFATVFDSNYNTYTFSNISRLIAYCHSEKRRVMREQGITSEAYNANNPDWNKAVVLPVVIRTATDSQTQGTVQVSVTHDFSISSTRLVGGTTPQPLQIIYSTYQN